MEHLPQTRTISVEQVGAGSQTIISNATTTITAISMKQSGVASDSTLFCNSNPVAKNYSQEVLETHMNYLCIGNVSFSKTGADSSFLIMSYLPYDTRKFDTREILPLWVSPFNLFFAIMAFFCTMWFIIWFFRPKTI